MTLKVTPDNLRVGAKSIDAEKAVIGGINVPDEGAASAGLQGFATATQLSAADDAVKSAFKVAGGRFELIAKLCQDTATTFELTDMVTGGFLPPTWMSQQVGDGLTAMGDMNLSRP